MRKVTTTITMRRDVRDEAKRRNINISAAAESAVKQRILADRMREKRMMRIPRFSKSEMDNERRKNDDSFSV